MSNATAPAISLFMVFPPASLHSYTNTKYSPVMFHRANGHRVISATKPVNSRTFPVILTINDVYHDTIPVGRAFAGGLHSLPMKLLFAYVSIALLAVTGCQPTGHVVRQTMFQKDIYLHIQPTDFKETNRRSIHVLPHTWVTIKRISAVLADGTVVPCRDFQPGAFELIQDDDSAQLVGTLSLPTPDVAEVSIVIGQTGQCSGAEDATLSPCSLAAKQSTDDATNTSSDDIALHCTLASRDRDSPRIVIKLDTERTKELPTTPIPVMLTSIGTLPASLDAIDTPWLSLSPAADGTTKSLPYALTSSLEFQKTPSILKGTIDADTKAFTPTLMFELGAPEQITICGTVVRLDIAKRTFQLRVDGSSDGQPYGTLYFRVDDQTTYRFSGSLRQAPATFEDISIGRRLWVQVLQNPDSDARLNALSIQISTP